VLEALQNIQKYADATTARVTVDGSVGALAFAVEDDGIGFDPTGTDLGSGMSNMADRIDALGGRLEVISAPGRGTTIRATIPLPAGLAA
jgi:signal transduction histidine kinase